MIAIAVARPPMSGGPTTLGSMPATRTPMASEDRHQLPSSGGFSIAAWSALPAGTPAGSAVLCHGLTTDAADNGAFPPLRDRLLRRNLAVVRFDARCHGATGGGWRALTLDGWRDDVLAAVGLASQLATGPIVLVASSFAGGPAIEAASREPRCRAIALWNPVLDYVRNFLTDDHWAGAQVQGTAGAPSLPDWAELAIPWGDVPLSSRLIAEFRADETLRRLRNLEAGILIIHGRRDRFVPLPMIRNAIAGSTELELRTIPLAGHGFRGCRWIVRRRTVRWLTARVRESHHDLHPAR
jgi:pimeloyl-ACP methyl ester carboxylesterase